MRKSPFYFYLLLIIVVSCTGQNSDRDSWQQPENVMDTIEVKPGMIIGEPGAGEGYFTFKLSHRVGPTGRIYANEIDTDKLETIQKRIKKEGIENITTILGKTEDPLFPQEALDMVVMVNVLHHLDKPIQFFKNIKPSLKKGAGVVIIERDPEKYSQDYDHFLSKDKVKEKIKQVNFKLVRFENFLARDNIYICLPH
jgi:predicted methyltransferase